MEIRNVKGTHDIFGEETKIYDYVIDVFSRLCKRYGASHIVIPTIEHTELFQRGVGEGSDVVRKEMYTFEDKGGRLITLRPEFTAGIVRSFIQNKFYVNDLPCRLFYHGSVFRYERPQQGRYRQFNQLGVEFLGSDNFFVDVETISLAFSFLKKLGLDKNVIVKINSLGDLETRNNYRQALKDYFAQHLSNMCEDCQSRYELNPLRILDCKVDADRAYIEKAPSISTFLSPQSSKRFNDTIEALKQLEIPFEIDQTLVRGLDYYSEVVYEIHIKNANEGAIGAGGHYSTLIEELGGPKMSGVGFSFGLERLVSLFAAKSNLSQQAVKDEIDVYIMPIGDGVHSHALKIAQYLRDNNISSEICLEKTKLGNMFKKAQKRNAKFALIVGEDEIKNQTVQLKNLSTTEQIEVKIADILNKIKE